MRLTLLLLFISFPLIGQELATIYNEGKTCYTNKDYPCYYNRMARAFALDSNQVAVRYHYGIASAMTGEKQRAFRLLRSALWMNADLSISDHKELSVLHAEPEWGKLVTLQKNLKQPIVHSDTASVLPDRTLHLEGLAFEKPFFYGTAIHERKLVRFNSSATKYSKISNELPSFFGIEIDRQRKLIWTTVSPIKEMRDYDSTLHSYACGYDMASLVLKKKFITPTSHARILGDITIDKKGRLFISDSQNNEILTQGVNDTLEIFWKSDEVVSLQGITLSEDERYLFFADYMNGIYRLDLKTKMHTKIRNVKEPPLKGVDGLEFYKGSLIAIQNGVYPLRVVRYFLNSSMDSVTGYEIIDWNHPAFNEPTNGTIVDNVLYYIANSQWTGYDENGIQKPSSELQDIVILKYSLK